MVLEVRREIRDIPLKFGDIDEFRIKIIRSKMLHVESDYKLGRKIWSRVR